MLTQAAPARRRRLLRADERLVVLATDERLDALARLIVRALARRALHEIRAGRAERALEPAIEAQLQTSNRVGDDARAVGRVPHLQLELGVQWDVAVCRAFHPDVAPLAVQQPRHVVARA